MRFEVSSQAAVEDFLVVAASAPIARLDDADTTAAGIHARGTTLVAPADSALPTTSLDALARELAGTPGTRLWRFRLPHATDPAPPRARQH